MSNVNKPEMIMFDFGHTLIYEPFFDGTRGMEALLSHATHNEYNTTAEQLSEFGSQMFESLGHVRKLGYELHNHNMDRFVYEYLGIELPLSSDEIEYIFWDNISTMELMPNIEKLLEYLHVKGIRTGVISNIGFGGATLKKKLESLLPNHHFEFIIASSDYVFRKPNKLIFELALRKAKLSADRVWYCGDSPEYDAAGANAAGIYPVWYHSDKACYYRDKDANAVPDCDHLYIRDWLELIDVLK